MDLGVDRFFYLERD